MNIAEKILDYFMAEMMPWVLVVSLFIIGVVILAGIVYAINDVFVESRKKKKKQKPPYKPITP
jgi:uncharacterized membrane protein